MQFILNIWKTFNVTQRGFGIVISHSEVESPWLMSESDDYACVAKTFCIQHVQLYTQKDLFWNKQKNWALEHFTCGHGNSFSCLLLFALFNLTKHLIPFPV